MNLNPSDPFFESALRNVIRDEVGPLPLLVRQLQNFQAPAFTVATLPASGLAGQVVFVSDGAAGAKFRGWDGSAWVNLG